MAVSAVAGLATAIGAAAAAGGLTGLVFFGLTKWAAFAAWAALGAGLTMVSRALAPKPNLGAQLRGITQTSREPAGSRKLVYGKIRTGGQVVFISHSGDDNKYLHMAIAFASHEIESFEEIWFNDKKVWTTAGFQSDWGTYVTIDRKFGTATQTASQQLKDAHVQWTDNHKLSGIAYVAFKLEWNQDKFPQGVPNITAVVKGKKVYDPRDSNQSATDASTWTYSTNPALCLRDYLVDQKYGLGEDRTLIDSTALTAAANLCDETQNDGVDIYSTSGQKRYQLNGVLDAANNIKDNIEQMLSAMGGNLTYSGGKYFIKGAEYVAPTVTFDEADCVSEIAVQTKQSRRGVYNGVKGIFVAENKNWKVLDYPAQISSTYEAEDGDPIYLDMPLPFVTNEKQAQLLAKLALLRSRQQTVLQVTVNLKGLQVKVGDTVNITNTRLGYSSKVFEVIEYSLSAPESGPVGVDLTLIETGSAVYDWTTSDEQDFLSGGELDLYDGRTVDNVTSLSHSVIGLKGPDGKNITTVDFTWTAPTDAFVEFYVVTLEKDDDGNVFEYQTREPRLRVPNLDIGSAYEVIVKAQNLIGVRSSGTTLNIASLAGDITPPEKPTNFTAVGGVRQITVQWDDPTDEDFALTRIFVANSDSIPATSSKTRGSEFVYTLADNEDGEVTKYFWLKSEDYSGNVSAATASFTGTSKFAASDDVNIDADDVGLGNVENRDSQDQVETGIETGATVTAGGITLSGGGSIKGGQTEYDDADAAGFFLGYSGATYKFSIGNSDNSKKLTFDGSDLTVTGAIKGGSIQSNNTNPIPTNIFTRTGVTQNIPTGDESGAFLDLSGGSFVFGDADSFISFAENSAGTAFELDIKGVLAPTTLDFSAVTDTTVMPSNIKASGYTNASVGVDALSSAVWTEIDSRVGQGTGGFYASATGNYLGTSSQYITLASTPDHGVEDVTIKVLVSDTFAYPINYTYGSTATQINVSLFYKPSTDTDWTNEVQAGTTQTFQANPTLLQYATRYTIDANYSVTLTSGSGGDIADNIDYDFRVKIARVTSPTVFMQGGSGGANDSTGTPITLEVSENASGVSATGGNADTLDNLQATDFFRLGSSGSTIDNTAYGDQTFTGDVTVTGTLNLQGSIDQYNVTDLEVVDKTITVNSGNTQALSDGAGLIVDRGTADDASITWNETADRFEFTNYIKLPASDPRLLTSGNDYLDFDDDSQSYGTGTNATVLASISDLVLRTNTNDGGGGLFRVSTGGSSPTSLLDITTAGDATFAGNITLSTGNAIYFDGSTNTYITESSADVLKIVVGGDEFMRFTEGTNLINVFDPMFIDGDANIQNVFKIRADNTISNQDFISATFDFNFSGTETHTTDNYKYGLFIDFDSSDSGGDTNHETRLFPLYIDARNNAGGTADRLDAAYIYARNDGSSNMAYLRGTFSYAFANNSAGTTTNVYGIQSYGYDDTSGSGSVSTVVGAYSLGYASGTGTGTLASVYGAWNMAVSDATNTKNITSMFGARNEVQLDSTSNAHTITNVYATFADIDENDADDQHTVTNGYLYYGQMSGTLPTNAYGIYIATDIENYFAGDITSNGDITGYKLRATSSADASLSSTDHAFQTGSSAGVNIIIDTNEIMARNNGAASDLHLQADGGSTTYGNNLGGRIFIQPSAGNAQITIRGGAGDDAILKLLEQGTGDVGAIIEYHGIDNKLRVKVGNNPPNTALEIDRDTGAATFEDKLTAKDQIRAEVISYANNQNAPYMIASTGGWTGATTNWNTYGIQHRIKTSSGGVPRVTIDTAVGEMFSVDNNGNATIAGVLNFTATTYTIRNQEDNSGQLLIQNKNSSGTLRGVRWDAGNDSGGAWRPDATGISSLGLTNRIWNTLYINNIKVGTSNTTFMDSSRNITAGTIASGNITMTGTEFRFVSSADSNLGMLLRDETYVSDEMDITATRLGSGNTPTLGLAGQSGINFYVGGSNVGLFDGTYFKTTSVIQADKLGTATSASNQFNSADIRLYASGWDVNNSVARTVGWKIRNIPTASNYPDHDLHFIEDDQGSQYTKFQLHGRGSNNHTDPRAGTFFGNLHVAAGSGTNAGIGTATIARDLTVQNGELRVVRTGDNFPTFEIARTGGSTKTDQQWDFTIGSTGHLNIRSATGSTYYPIILTNAGDISLGSDTAGANPSVSIDQSNKKTTFNGLAQFTNTDSTGRGIYRNNTGYDLRLGGGTSSSNGAYISISGETRGGSGSGYNGRLEYYTGGSGFANQAAVNGDHKWYAAYSGGAANLMSLDSATGDLTIHQGDIRIPVARNIYFGASDHTYIGEDINDRLRFFTGGAEFMRFTEGATDTVHFYKQIIQQVTNIDNAWNTTYTDNDPDNSRTAMRIDYNASGNAALTGDRTHIAFEVDYDVTSTGGNTTDEYRAYGIYSDIRGTGDTDLRYAIYGYAETQHSAGTVSDNVGVYGFAVADETGSGRTTTNTGGKFLAYAYNSGTGGTTNHYGVFSKVLLTSAADKNTATAIGVYGEVEVDTSGTTTTLSNARVFQAEFDQDATDTTVTNGYLYYGNYSGTLPNSAYGVYIVDAVRNYFGGYITTGDGSVSAPSYSFNGDTNTGMFSPADHQLGFAVNGSRKFRLVANNAYFENLSGGVTIGTDTGDAFNSGSLLRLQQSANTYVQIKTGTSNQCGLLLGDTSDDFVGGLIYRNVDNHLDFYAGNIQGARLEPDAKFRIYGTQLKVGDGGTNGEIDVLATANAYFKVNGSTKFTLTSGGNATFTGNVTAFSDARLKSDIETLDGSKVYAMRGVSYTTNGEAGSGVVAQELEQVASELVIDNDDGYKSVAYGNLVGYLIEAVKDQKAIIDDLTKRIEELENGNN